MRIRPTSGRRVCELEQVDPGRLRRVAEAQMHSPQISRLHSERLGHFLAGHARSEVEDDLEAEQLVERQRALQVHTVDVEVEDPLNHGSPAPADWALAPPLPLLEHRRQAAIHKQLGAGHEGGLVARQEGGSVADVGRGAHPLKHLTFLDLFDDRLRVLVPLEQMLDERRPHPARRDGIDTNRRAIVDRHVTRERNILLRLHTVPDWNG